TQEWDREVRDVPVQACVPTAAEFAGDFSGPQFTGAAAPTVQNPAGKIATDQCGAQQPAHWVGGVYTSTIPAALQAPGNQFALANVDPAGQIFSQFYPAPNGPLTGGNNWFLSERTKPSWYEFSGRADYNLTSKQTATF